MPTLVGTSAYSRGHSFSRVKAGQIWQKKRAMIEDALTSPCISEPIGINEGRVYVIYNDFSGTETTVDLFLITSPVLNASILM